MGVEQLAKQIIDTKNIEGVTFSGGEPFEQASALARVCEILKQQSDLSILAYTGYRVSELTENHSRYGNFLDQLDILIDGEYRQDKNGPYAYRGSANQSIIEREDQVGNPLEDSVKNTMPFKSVSRSTTGPDSSEYEIQVALHERSFVLTGFPESGVDNKLREALAKRGILMSNPRRETAKP